MKKRRTFLWIGLIGLVVVCLACGGAVYLLSNIPSVESQVYPGSTALHVYLSAPESPGGWPLNAYIPVQAQASGSEAVAKVELYINGQLYQTSSTPAGWTDPEFAANWTWQPGATGSFILYAKATGVSGATGISDPILLDVTEAVGTVSPYLAQEGDTLATIAEVTQVSLEDLEAENPAITDPDQPLPADTPLSVPNPPDPVANPIIIQGLPLIDLAEVAPVELGTPPLPESTDTGSDADNPSFDPVKGFQLPSAQDVQFWINQILPGKKASLPLEPVLKATFTDCDVTLTLSNSPVFDNSSDPAVDTSSNEEGFFLYQSQDGGDFQRIATLPAVDYFLTWESYDGYHLEDQYGVVTYAISAFNAAGETMSTPVTLPLDQANCQNPDASAGQSSIQLVDGNLVLPYAMDLAYVYMSVNGGQSYRIPEGDRMFLPESGVTLNLYDYFSTLLDTFTAADFDIAMEVWGWSGAELKFIGNYETTIHRSVLLVCSEEGEGKCSGNGDGQWVSEVNFADQKPIAEQVFMFKWISSQISKTNDVCYQFAAGPYPDDNFWNMNLPISSGCMEYIKGSEGTFTEYMSSLLYPTEPPEFYGWGAGSELFDYNSDWFKDTYKEGTPFTLYVRALPRLEMSGFTQYSNTVVMHNGTTNVPSELPPLASPYPSLYEVEILEDTYIPPTFETEANWGCVVIDEDPSNPANVGKTVCPPLITAHDDCEGQVEALCLLKGMGNSILFLVDHFVYAISAIKWEMTEAISYAIPYCHDYGPCYKAIEETVEQIVYYGIGYPPHTDTSEDLMAGWIGSGMLSTASDYTSEIGIDEETLRQLCDDDCQKDIGLQMIQMIREKRSMESQQACINSYDAYFHNREAMCLDPSIIVHPAEGSGNYPAGITVKITRRVLADGQTPPQDIGGNYSIRVAVTGSSDTTVFGPGYSAPLYATVDLPVYDLAPGESMVLNTKLLPCSLYGDTACGEYEDWEAMSGLYYNGTTNIEATELCYSPDSSVPWVPCTGGGYDSYQFENPKILEAVQP